MTIQGTIAKLQNLLKVDDVLCYYKSGIQKVIETIQMDAQTKQGKWITKYDGNGWNDYWDYTCPYCGKTYERADNVLYKSNFCPNCGKKVKHKVRQ